MKKYLFSFCLIISFIANAQSPDDALRTAWFTQNGSARMMAVGGVMGSLGGDISAANINPAGLGLYKTREIVLTPGFFSNNNKLSYRGTDTSSNKNIFSNGPIGIIFGSSGNNQKKWTSSAFAISVSQLANYNNHIQYTGSNNNTSFTEQYLEELARDRADTNSALSNYIFGSSLAFRTFLIDTTIVNGQLGYKSLVPLASPSNPTAGVMQSYDANTTGGYQEIALSLAGNMEDKLYVGGTVTIPVISYQRDFFYSEKDATNNPNNNFAYFNYTESLKSTGVGVGLKLGMIYKPKDFWRIGFAFHSPQWISFKDEIRASITANTEAYAGLRTVTSDELNSGNPGTREYNILTPWRAIASASYVFREVANTKKQRAFVSADIEYVNYRGARFSTTGNNNSSAMQNYYSMVNGEIKDYYKGNVNLKLGGELKFDPWMFRLGAAYYGSPYADNNLKADRFVTAAGIGYRNYGFFIDITYSATFVKDVNFPYRLNDVPNTYATQSGNINGLIITFGFKF